MARCSLRGTTWISMAAAMLLTLVAPGLTSGGGCVKSRPRGPQSSCCIGHGLGRFPLSRLRGGGGGTNTGQGLLPDLFESRWTLKGAPSSKPLRKARKRGTTGSDPLSKTKGVSSKSDGRGASSNASRKKSRRAAPAGGGGGGGHDGVFIRGFPGFSTPPKKWVCQHPSCSTAAYFGAPNASSDAMFCSTHKPDGCRNIRDKMCQHAEGCEKRPAYGSPADRVALFCATHKKPTDVDVRNTMCQHPTGCTLRPTYGDSTTRVPRFCGRHMHPSHIQLANKACEVEECFTRASFGEEGGRPITCGSHRRKGYVDLRHRRCEEGKRRVRAKTTSAPAMGGGDVDSTHGAYGSVNVKMEHGVHGGEGSEDALEEHRGQCDGQGAETEMSDVQVDKWEGEDEGYEVSSELLLPPVTGGYR